MFCVRYKEKTA